ncbi:hypothetical protein ACQKP0_23810 [Heyndrickxia sp. NPDC080065]|uniref:hypothetical protein n=1 Tax=Heyndrickxia sp. NPDC080065 TaxID=3390568 RepID=UPI003D088A89
MKKIGFNILLICFNCFPFVFFSMYLDYKNGSMLGYLLMIIGISVIAFYAKASNNTFALIIGNIGSLIVSYYFIGKMGDNEHWGGYFKPLTPSQLLILVSILNLIPQFITVIAANKLKNKVGWKQINISGYSIYSLLCAIIGFTFSMLFQSMAYWGNETMLWYWVGAVLSYLFSLISITFILFFNIKETPNFISVLLLFISVLFIFATIFWTTFIIIAWQSGF